MFTGKAQKSAGYVRNLEKTNLMCFFARQPRWLLIEIFSVQKLEDDLIAIGKHLDLVTFFCTICEKGTFKMNMREMTASMQRMVKEQQEIG